MRIAEVDYTNHYKITYPEQFIFTEDNNYIKVESVDGTTPVGAEIRITNPRDGNSKILRHTSELSYIIFNLNDTIKNIYDGDQQTFVVDVTCLNMGITDGSFSFRLNVLFGKSYTDKAHGIERTIFIYDDTDAVKLQFFSHVNGMVSVADELKPIYYGYNAIDVDFSKLNEGSNPMCIYSQSTLPILQINNVYGITQSYAIIELALNGTTDSGPTETKGDIWSDSKLQTDGYCIDLNYVRYCNDTNTIKLRYKNHDGMIRYIMGRIVEETNNVKSSTYHQFDGTIYRNIPHRHTTEDSRDIKVVFSDIPRNAYLTDILYTNKLEFRNYDGEWYECAIKDNSITSTDEEYEDIELTITLNKD